MEIVRKKGSKKGRFPEWEKGKVVELFRDGASNGLYIMADAGYNVLISLESGNWWSDNDAFDMVDYAVVVNGKFVEE